MNRTLILVNPWVYDFAAYDLWSKPLGLLYLAGYLRACGFDVQLIDCLDVHHPGMKRQSSAKAPKRGLYGTGKFFREDVPKPPALAHVPRSYGRYGITPDLFEYELKRISRPSAILVTSLMTYWYPGVQTAIELARKIHPHVPVVLGGTYARLCESHARGHCGADRVVTDGQGDAVLDLFEEYGIPVPNRPAPRPFQPYPAFDLLTRLDYICLLTSLGCPYRCRYCASHFLNPGTFRRSAPDVVEEVLFWHRDFGVRDVAFYDDALLVRSPEHAVPILRALLARGLNIRFHTPNALHVKEMTADIARLLRLTGFRTIRLGLETADISLHETLDKKVSAGDFERAVGHLHAAGYESGEIGAYILIGLPGQTADSVFETLEHVEKAGAIPYLSEYSPLPHTPMWEQAVRHSACDLTSEPLYHNNTLLPCWDESEKTVLPALKKRVQEIRLMTAAA